MTNFFPNFFAIFFATCTSYPSAYPDFPNFTEVSVFVEVCQLNGAYAHSIPTTNVSLSSDVVAVFDPHPVSAKAHTMADAINFLKFIFLFSFSNRQRIEKSYAGIPHS